MVENIFLSWVTYITHGQKSSIFCATLLIFSCTVVPALGDPCRERPPAVCSHFVNIPTYFKVKLPVISGHLPNADSHLLVVSTCYNGQCKQIPRFRWLFQPKIAGVHPNLRPTDLSNFRVVVWWLWQCVYPLGISLVVIVLCTIARCIIFGVPRLPVRPCDERPPAMYGHFCLVPRVSVHDRYYCTYKYYFSFFFLVSIMLWYNKDSVT